MRQQWYCSACDVLATCTMRKGVDVYTAVNGLAASHKRWSPKCAEKNGINKVRVRAPGTTPEEWGKIRRPRGAETPPLSKERK